MQSHGKSTTLNVVAGMPIAHATPGRGTRRPGHYIFVSDANATETRCFVSEDRSVAEEECKAAQSVLAARAGSGGVSAATGVIGGLTLHELHKVMEKRNKDCETLPDGISEVELFVVVLSNDEPRSELIDLSGPIPALASGKEVPGADPKEVAFANATVRVANKILKEYDPEHTTVIVVSNASVSQTDA